AAAGAPAPRSPAWPAAGGAGEPWARRLRVTLRVGFDRAPPRAGGGAARLDQMLEAAEVLLHLQGVDAQQVARLLTQPVGCVADLGGHPAAVVTEAVEGDHAVGAAVGAPPGDALIGQLLGDLRVPLARRAGHRGRPAEVGVVDLLDRVDPAHEARELLELRPLVVRLAHGH